jgi:transcription elongation GreA/GreB family factor
MDKALIIREIVRRIEHDLQVMTEAAKAAHAAATDEDNQGEGRHDMRAVEASYLAGAQSKRAAEMQALIHHYRNLELRSFEKKDATSAVSALMDVECEGRQTRYFLVDREGGFSVKLDGPEVQVLSVHSPLGAELVGRVQGEDFEVTLGNGRKRDYTVVSML